MPTRKRLLIQEFDLTTETFTGGVFGYKLDARGTNIGDMTAINSHEFLVIERNGATATGGGTPFKKIFRIDLNRVDAAGFVAKSEVVDLMNISDPNDLNGDGSTTFTFPFVTIEDVLILDANTLLEGTVTGDPTKSLRINAFSIDTEAYTGQQWLYALESAGTNIGDMTAINDHEFLVIERNGIQGTNPNAADGYKKIFKIDIDRIDADGFAAKSEVVDLLNLFDPNDLNLDGKTRFDFPFVTIENVLILDANTLLVINDNNYPGNGGRTLNGPDSIEFIKIRLDSPLAITAAVPEPETYALMFAGLLAVAFVKRRREV